MGWFGGERGFSTFRYLHHGGWGLQVGQVILAKQVARAGWAAARKLVAPPAVSSEVARAMGVHDEK